ncbi:MAG: hypothetical protein GWM92_07270 [Gemmatimonadetes bacterium]|nr:OmpH family outer membrane protein [Gemmatimonadota bacterium]NIR78419.1 OmpH family outer membrane protein [Gemmatimonadota bacterium]NIT87031.1 OmpH family outer membrane protein [Gemmatimonadota bacterium]NIU30869.1 OmpH family outer membrane protein [Gemmatimonadota bacterium]NIU35638.1 hypothetical protein [Gemmatimonadota bacterium]
MRRLIFLAAAILVPASAAPVGAQSGVKIGYINSQEIIQEAPGAQQARQELEQQLSEYREEVQQMGEELQQLIERYEQQQMTLSEQARQDRQEEIRQRQQEYQQRVQQLEDQAARRQQEVVAPIMQRINAVIEDIRRQGAYTVIFDVAAQGIVAADPGLDLTAEVIRRLKEQTATPGG